jgi:ankyrin repeat protein
MLLPPSGNTQEIRSIYAHYGSLDISDYDLRTPLHVAVSLGKLDMVTFLLSLNVPISPVDRWGVTPLWSAVCEGKKDIAQLLRGRGGEIKQSNVTVSNCVSV